MQSEPSNKQKPPESSLDASLVSELEDMTRLLQKHPELAGNGKGVPDALALVRVLRGIKPEQWEAFASTHGLENWLSLALNEKTADAVAQLLAQQERLAFQRDHDALTGLKNRGCFNRKLDLEVERALRSHAELCLLFIDLDNFKAVNDTYGHDCGDIALQRLGALLERSVRHYDTPARIGGEEFAVILPATSCWTGVILGNRILELFRKEIFTCKGKELSMTFSGGVSSLSLLEPGLRTSAALFKSADTALYRAKASGKNNITLIECDKTCRDRNSLVLAQEKQFLFSSAGLE